MRILQEINITDLPSEQEKDYQIANIYFEEGLFGQAVQIWRRIRHYKDTDELLSGDEVWPVVYQSLTVDCLTEKTIELGIEPGNKVVDPIKWLVLASDDSGYLLVSEKALNCITYSSIVKAGDWEVSEIRSWLNDQFYNEAFSENEKSIIRMTKTGIANMTKQTEDKVFLLSEEEIQHYSTEKNDFSWLKCEPSEFASKNGAGGYANLSTCWWWTRTSCENIACAKTVNNLGKLSQEFKDKKGGGVRAAMWINAYFG